jgi:hypothetical protein
MPIKMVKMKKPAKSIEDDKMEYAKRLAKSHVEIEGTISGVAYITGSADKNADEPIKMLEINSATSASGFFPVTFGSSGEIPYPSTVVEITPEEAKKLEKNQLDGWPKDWKVGEWLYRRKRNLRSRSR